MIVFTCHITSPDFGSVCWVMPTLLRNRLQNTIPISIIAQSSAGSYFSEIYGIYSKSGVILGNARIRSSTLVWLLGYTTLDLVVDQIRC